VRWKKKLECIAKLKRFRLFMRISMDLNFKDWPVFLTISSALISPILAIQVQKAIEAFREKKTSKNSDL
jgi:hypothetical protein